ncbi:TIGR04222 domain-containing membrane protein [Amycolatopsis sp. NPDC058278]|uniref:TIGR04222 domain-containing membrane protein n=1 Tax=Amycolatopsis sp. NPDC058278 TaxID=3346417 RepID=UPI0036DCE82F
MTDPWGISGPDFVVLYIALLGAVLLVRLVVTGIAVSWARRPGRAQPGPPPTVYQLAFLAGGPDRATDAAIAALVERGQLRVNSYKQISKTGTRPVEPLERAVFDIAKLKTTAVIRAKVRGSAAMRALADSLDERGLLSSANRQARTFGLVLQLAVLVLGIARLVNGVSLGRPVGILLFLTLLATVLALASAAGLKTAARRPSAAGHRVLGQARAAASGPMPAGALAGGVLLGGAVAAVALGGWAMYPDDELSAALMPSAGSGGGGSSGGSSCSSSSCSSGSSCGSSCGGGGCGG